jgi:NAD(P)-dependent dehydrogenase (short-subunit alcohol dehydrogenase family)
MSSTDSNRNAVILGASGGIGGALWQALRSDPRFGHVIGVSRSEAPDSTAPWLQADCTSAAALHEAANVIRERFGRLDLLINCCGTLQDGGRLQPEKALRDLDSGNLERLMAVNAFAPLAALRAFAPLLRHSPASVAVTLSAMVGSITDNRLGGWYSYRMSKAALNMGLKNAAIELGRGGRGPIVVAMHPGTTLTPLSEPFVSRHQHRLPGESARHMLSVIDTLTPESSGRFYSWDGRELPW